MRNGINKGTRLAAVRPGDVLTLQRSRFRVLSARCDADLVTLKLDDAPDRPLTLIGVAAMAVDVEASPDGGAAPGHHTEE